MTSQISYTNDLTDPEVLEDLTRRSGHVRRVPVGMDLIQPLPSRLALKGGRSLAVVTYRRFDDPSWPCGW